MKIIGVYYFTCKQGSFIYKLSPLFPLPPILVGGGGVAVWLLEATHHGAHHAGPHSRTEFTAGGVGVRGGGGHPGAPLLAYPAPLAPRGVRHGQAGSGV